MSLGEASTRIGWIGTGVMGSSMCGHLIAAGHRATVFNRTPAKAQSLVDRGATLSDKALLRQAGHTELCVSEGLDVCFGND